MGKGFDCFLDVEGLEEISDLPLLVAGCDALIFVLTDGVLESRWCLQELAAAMAAGVTVILITKEGARWPDEDGRKTCTFPPTHLIDSLEPAIIRKAFMSKAVAHSNEYYSAFSQLLLKRVQTAVDANASNPAERALERRQRLRASQELGSTSSPTATAGQPQSNGARASDAASLAIAVLPQQPHPTIPKASDAPPSLPISDGVLGKSPFDAALALAEVCVWL